MIQADHPVVGRINRRLQEARLSQGFSQKDWHRGLEGNGYKVSLSSVRNYEIGDEALGSTSRMPPADYIAQVAEVFGIRPEWLLYGREPMMEDPLTDGGSDERSDEESDEESDALEQAESIFGKETAEITERVPWLRGSIFLTFLRLLHDCKRAATKVDRDVHQGSISRFLEGLFRLPFDLPGADQWIVRGETLSPREKILVTMHLSSLVRLLFIPMRDADASFLRSQTLRGETSPDPDAP